MDPCIIDFPLFPFPLPTLIDDDLDEDVETDGTGADEEPGGTLATVSTEDEEPGTLVAASPGGTEAVSTDGAFLDGVDGTLKTLESLDFFFS